MSTQSGSVTSGRLGSALRSNRKVIFVEAVLVFVVVWSLASNLLNLADTISTPALLAVSTYQLVVSLDWIPHVVATFRRTLFGFVVTMVIGTVLGVAMGWSDFWEGALKDYIIVGLALPSLFAVVFSAMWFGISDVTPMVAAAAISFPFVTQAIYQGVKEIDGDLIGMSSSFGVSRARVVKRVVVESIMPEWFAGARYAFAVCWKITTLAEFLVGTNGIGFMIGFQMDQLSMTGVLTWTFLFMLIILVAEYGVFQQLEKRVFDWRQTEDLGWA